MSVQQYTPVSRADERTLIAILQNEDSSKKKRDQAAAKLYNAYEPWLAKQASIHQNIALEDDDAIAVAYAAFWRAIQRFDPSSNTRLATYARHWMLAYFGQARAQSQYSMVSTPRVRTRSYFSALAQSQHLSKEDARDHMTSLFASNNNMSIAKARTTIRFLELSTQSRAPLDNQTLYDESPSPEELADRGMIMTSIQRALDETVLLNIVRPIDRAIFLHHYLNENTISQTGADFRIKHTAVRTSLNRTTERLATQMDRFPNQAVYRSIEKVLMDPYTTHIERRTIDALLDPDYTALERHFETEQIPYTRQRSILNGLTSRFISVAETI